MSKSKVPRVYSDSNLFIAFLKGKEIDKKTGIDRTPICRQIIHDAKEGKIELFTSWGTMIECVTPPTGEATSSIGVDSVEELFDSEYIIKCDVDRFVATDAQYIQVNASRNASYQDSVKNPPDTKQIKKIRPIDALHVATALIQEVDYMFTYDDNHLLPLNKHDIVNGLCICTPCRPWDSGQMSIFDMQVTPEVEDTTNSGNTAGRAAEVTPAGSSETGIEERATEAQNISENSVVVAEINGTGDSKDTKDSEESKPTEYLKSLEEEGRAPYVLDE